MDRRHLLAALSASALGLAACKPKGQATACAREGKAGKVFKWKMVTTWPKNAQGAGEGAERLAKNIEAMSGGRIQIKVFGAGEFVPALQVFDTVSAGTAQMGHGGAYYWAGKLPVSPFFSAVPYGLTAQEINAWLYHGGGLELWRELYAPFKVLPFPGGNTGVQMAGWFNKEINTIEDLKGLKMRIPGLGARVLERAGGSPQLTPGGEVFTSLSTGVIDAAEWIGPFNDLGFGLHKAAKFYYYPGWHEPGSCLEAIVNAEAYAELPPELQAVVEQACKAANLDMLAEFTAKNAAALKTLVEEHKVQLRPLPEAVLATLRGYAEDIIAENVADDPLGTRIRDSFRAFRAEMLGWSAISEQAFLRARAS
ncbi:MAG: TRAP transporter substrate-binding protein [Gammaproteobacteria bacterium]|nr:TRAP transporter substrate-binding protein [Gammaproteobacteria bacterium]